ncbi:alpha/beta fold hydrolase [Mumia qirimensis]|uniref:alpha/beta fold hydrolase n=1 Tax=Mumia qirimensis TaxID=3234852 RepID=UPI00351CDCB5
MKRALGSVVVVLLLLLAVLASPASAGSPGGSRGHDREVRPIVFVHGSAGSASQFQTPALRFASNGYEAEDIEAVEYDTQFQTNTLAQVHARIDAAVAALLRRTGSDRVDLVGHSLGTYVSQQYLNSSPDRAARVAHYVNIDGVTATAPPGGVDTLALWAEPWRYPGVTREITGATNVDLGEQGHTEAVTSEKSFREMFRFFTGRAPATVDVRPERGRRVVSGRVHFFVSNLPVVDGTLKVYRVNRLNGARVGRPVSTFAVTDGAFGPFVAAPFARYEFELTRGEITHHFYTEPFTRSDRFVRLMTDQPGGIVRSIMTASPRHTNLTISRNKEWWSDQGDRNDTLSIDGAEILDGIAPRTKRAIGIAVGDQLADGTSVLGQPIAAFAAVPFITGVDQYLPAPRRFSGIRLRAVPRGSHRAHTLVVPAWPSSDHWVSVQFDAH